MRVRHVNNPQHHLPSAYLQAWLIKSVLLTGSSFLASITWRGNSLCKIKILTMSDKTWVWKNWKPGTGFQLCFCNLYWETRYSQKSYGGKSRTQILFLAFRLIIALFRLFHNRCHVFTRTPLRGKVIAQFMGCYLGIIMAEIITRWIQVSLAGDGLRIRVVGKHDEALKNLS